MLPRFFWPCRVQGTVIGICLAGLTWLLFVSCFDFDLLLPIADVTPIDRISLAGGVIALLASAGLTLSSLVAKAQAPAIRAVLWRLAVVNGIGMALTLLVMVIPWTTPNPALRTWLRVAFFAWLFYGWAYGMVCWVSTRPAI